MQTSAELRRRAREARASGRKPWRFAERAAVAGAIIGRWLCGDFNRVKGPILRGLAARAPYFHNGAAANLDEPVNFYNQRFQMNLTAEQKTDLIAFLNSL